MKAADRAERIRRMEEALVTSREAVDGLSEAIVALVDALDGITELAGYYGSQDWVADRRADERCELPKDLARGVLGEDEAYELLIDAREVSLGAIEAATSALRVL